MPCTSRPTRAVSNRAVTYLRRNSRSISTRYPPSPPDREPHRIAHSSARSEPEKCTLVASRTRGSVASTAMLVRVASNIGRGGFQRSSQRLQLGPLQAVTTTLQHSRVDRVQHGPCPSWTPHPGTCGIHCCIQLTHRGHGAWRAWVCHVGEHPESTRRHGRVSPREFPVCQGELRRHLRVRCAGTRTGPEPVGRSWQPQVRDVGLQSAGLAGESGHAEVLSSCERIRQHLDCRLPGVGAGLNEQRSRLVHP
jgi:hypothetical protein